MNGMLQVYLVTLGGVALAQMAPGPNLLAVVGAALGQGRRAAVFVAFGIATAIFAWATVAAFGFGALLALHPSLLPAMKLLGGGYLCFLAMKALWAARRGGNPAFQASRPDWTPLGAWRRGLLVNLTNPKSALMWAAVSTFLFGSGLSAGQVAGFAPFGFASACVVYGAYGLLFSSGPVRGAYARFARGFEALFGLAFGAIGGKLIADGMGEIGR